MIPFFLQNRMKATIGLNDISVNFSDGRKIFLIFLHNENKLFLRSRIFLSGDPGEIKVFDGVVVHSNYGSLAYAVKNPSAYTWVKKIRGEILNCDSGDELKLTVVLG